MNPRRETLLVPSLVDYPVILSVRGSPGTRENPTGYEGENGTY
jgi:hypothetical protein